jgi:dolichol-phosphate mannosyltransferase
LDDEGRISHEHEAEAHRNVHPHHAEKILRLLEKLVIIPTYNERENIAPILQAIHNLGQDFHVLVIDDGSPDGTADVVRSLQPQFGNTVFLEERTGKLGLGTAYIHGFKWGIKRGYNYIFEMDADFSHNPADLPRLYEACKNGRADVAIGSRYVKGGGIKNWPKNQPPALCVIKEKCWKLSTSMKFIL